MGEDAAAPTDITRRQLLLGAGAAFVAVMAGCALVATIEAGSPEATVDEG